MTAWNALVPPRLETLDYAGRCLPFAQSFFGAPARHDSAWEAWEACQHRHGPDEPLPDVPVLLWYSHWGTYWVYSQGRYRTGEWGHVTAHVPGDAIYSSPGVNRADGLPSQERWATIAQIESRFGCRYVGWSEDINGVRFAQPGEEDDMFTDEDRALLRQTAAKANASYDALFKQTPTSRGERAGVLSMTNAIYDSQFKETETSRGTPGGTLVNDRITLAKLDAIITHFGIEVPEESTATEQAGRLKS